CVPSQKSARCGAAPARGLESRIPLPVVEVDAVAPLARRLCDRDFLLSDVSDALARPPPGVVAVHLLRLLPECGALLLLLQAESPSFRHPRWRVFRRRFLQLRPADAVPPSSVASRSG